MKLYIEVFAIDPIMTKDLCMHLCMYVIFKIIYSANSYSHMHRLVLQAPHPSLLLAHKLRWLIVSAQLKTPQLQIVIVTGS